MLDKLPRDLQENINTKLDIRTRSNLRVAAKPFNSFKQQPSHENKLKAIHVITKRLKASSRPAPPTLAQLSYTLQEFVLKNKEDPTVQELCDIVGSSTTNKTLNSIHKIISHLQTHKSLATYDLDTAPNSPYPADSDSLNALSRAVASHASPDDLERLRKVKTLELVVDMNMVFYAVQERNLLLLRHIITHYPSAVSDVLQPNYFRILALNPIHIATFRAMQLPIPLSLLDYIQQIALDNLDFQAYETYKAWQWHTH